MLFISIASCIIDSNVLKYDTEPMYSYPGDIPLRSSYASTRDIADCSFFFLQQRTSNMVNANVPNINNNINFE